MHHSLVQESRGVLVSITALRKAPTGTPCHAEPLPETNGNWRDFVGGGGELWRGKEASIEQVQLLQLKTNTRQVPTPRPLPPITYPPLWLPLPNGAPARRCHCLAGDRQEIIPSHQTSKTLRTGFSICRTGICEEGEVDGCRDFYSVLITQNHMVDQ